MNCWSASQPATLTPIGERSSTRDEIRILWNHAKGQPVMVTGTMFVTTHAGEISQNRYTVTASFPHLFRDKQKTCSKTCRKKVPKKPKQTEIACSGYTGWRKKKTWNFTRCLQQKIMAQRRVYVWTTSYLFILPYMLLACVGRKFSRNFRQHCRRIFQQSKFSSSLQCTVTLSSSISAIHTDEQLRKTI